jgi:hypothetical protein
LRRFIPTVVALVAAALMMIPAFASGSTKAHGAAFKGKGKTSRGAGVTLLLASTGRRVQITTTWQVSCEGGGTITHSETITGPSTPGRFRGHHLSRVKFDFITNDPVTLDDQPATLETEVTGNIRLDTGNAKGTIQPTVTLVNSGAKCTSGNTPITYSARF